MEYLSKQRYDEIAAELKHLIYEVYPKVTDDLAEASAQGDRSDIPRSQAEPGENHQPDPFPAEDPGAFPRNRS